MVIIGLTYDNSTLMYSVRDDAYTEGPQLSVPLSGAVALPFKSTFILIGGYRDLTPGDSTT